MKSYCKSVAIKSEKLLPNTAYNLVVGLQNTLVKKFKYNTSSLTVVKRGNIQVIIKRKTLTKQGNEINNCLTD